MENVRISSINFSWSIRFIWLLKSCCAWKSSLLKSLSNEGENINDAERQFRNKIILNHITLSVSGFPYWWRRKDSSFGSWYSPVAVEACRDLTCYRGPKQVSRLVACSVSIKKLDFIINFVSALMCRMIPLTFWSTPKSLVMTELLRYSKLLVFDKLIVKTTRFLSLRNTSAML